MEMAPLIPLASSGRQMFSIALGALNPFAFHVSMAALLRSYVWVPAVPHYQKAMMLFGMIVNLVALSLDNHNLKSVRFRSTFPRKL